MIVAAYAHPSTTSIPAVSALVLQNQLLFYMNHHPMHIKCQPVVVLSPECLQLMLLDEPPIMTSTGAMVLHPLAGGTMAGSCHITISVIIFL